MKIQTCKFVTLSAILEGTSDQFQECFLDGLGNTEITWGGANRTMIDMDTMSDFITGFDPETEAETCREEDDLLETFVKDDQTVSARMDAARNSGAEYVDLEN